MDITFAATLPADAPRLVARLVEQDKLPADLPAAASEGAAAARFTGKAGQLFESFHADGGKLLRLALVGLGKGGDKNRQASLEKAGAALSARFLVSGESALVLDVTGSGLKAAEVASVLLGARLRAWRWDAYRTKLREEQKPTLTAITVVGAPSGAEAAWQDAAAVATGVEFTRELVAEPANVIYPQTFVERCQARFEGTGAEVQVLDEDEMRTLGMGSLLGVGQGSARDSKLLVIKWMGGNAGEAPLAFVGKGVTF
ncbi:MAG: leucyl aminopeptidase, partial [Erythrobacter sp.]|nr:leucyl aminopeptidase [Erythrobacter sp.]